MVELLRQLAPDKSPLFRSWTGIRYPDMDSRGKSSVKVTNSVGCEEQNAGLIFE